jgi:hypothetical protein
LAIAEKEDAAVTIINQSSLKHTISHHILMTLDYIIHGAT